MVSTSSNNRGKPWCHFCGKHFNTTDELVQHLWIRCKDAAAAMYETTEVIPPRHKDL